MEFILLVLAWIVIFLLIEHMRNNRLEKSVRDMRQRLDKLERDSHTFVAGSEPIHKQ